MTSAITLRDPRWRGTGLLTAAVALSGSVVTIVVELRTREISHGSEVPHLMWVPRMSFPHNACQ